MSDFEMNSQPDGQYDFSFKDSLPPERDYDSRDDVAASINEWARQKGFAFAYGRCRNFKGKQTITYPCHRCHQPPDPTKKRRNSSSIEGTGCHFSVQATRFPGKSVWNLRHRRKPRFSVHNHPLGHSVSTLSTSDFQFVNMGPVPELSAAVVSLDHVRASQMPYSNTPRTQPDIFNRMASNRRDGSAATDPESITATRQDPNAATQQDPATPIRQNPNVATTSDPMLAFIDQLDKEGFWTRRQLNSNGRVIATLFAHPESLGYLLEYSDVLMLDCADEVNKDGMLLLDMIGLDACQRSFCIASALLIGGGEPDISWALDRLRSMYERCGAKLPSVILTERRITCMEAVAEHFPDSHLLLSLSHANAEASRLFEPAQVSHESTPGSTVPQTSSLDNFHCLWDLIINSPNEQAFNDSVSQFERIYLQTHPREVAYIKTTWLESCKDKLVKAWVDQHLHFGNLSVSRQQGIAALIKSHLKKPTLELTRAWIAIKPALVSQVVELRTNQMKQRTQMPTGLSGPLFDKVRGLVSHEALEEVRKQLRLLETKDPASASPCGGSFTRSRGLPCSHKLKTLQGQDQPLQLGDFHPHWHLKHTKRATALPVPKRIKRTNPAQMESTGPDKRARRESITVEYIDLTDIVDVDDEPPNTCNRCKMVGHSQNSIACPLRRQTRRSLL